MRIMKGFSKYFPFACKFYRKSFTLDATLCDFVYILVPWFIAASGGTCSHLFISSQFTLINLRFLKKFFVFNIFKKYLLFVKKFASYILVHCKFCFLPSKFFLTAVTRLRSFTFLQILYLLTCKSYILLQIKYS